jgi:hypothetical protein
MLKAGEMAPELRDAEGDPVHGVDGEPVQIEELRSEGPVVLVFLRGFS